MCSLRRRRRLRRLYTVFPRSPRLRLLRLLRWSPALRVRRTTPSSSVWVYPLPLSPLPRWASPASSSPRRRLASPCSSRLPMGTPMVTTVLRTPRCNGSRVGAALSGRFLTPKEGYSHQRDECRHQERPRIHQPVHQDRG